MTERRTDIALDLSDSESQALYDDHAKRLLGYRWILAAFLKEVLPGVAGYTVAQIVEMIDPDIQISTTRLHPDLRVRGLNTEYKDVPDEHDNGKKKKRSRQIRFDILFRIRLPEGARRFLINIEIQKEKPEKYVLADRATAYGAQGITSQMNVEYLKGNYSDMMPVYSIWIVAGQKKNTVSTWKLTERTDGTPGEWGEADKLRLMILGFNERSGYQEGEKPTWNLLRSLFSTTMKVEEKLEILERYDVPVIEDVEEEVLDMCNLGRGVYENGQKSGILLGEDKLTYRMGRLKEAMIKAGRQQEFLDAVGNMKAMDRLFAEFGI
ncbi:hypothetical protein [uncultured Faecalibaculum sp.]|uniref:hypothetical protein n=1 Tax=uncultured Faecalibaculum sp. TaxID=1729681 RepID=UPI0026378127|nr:hypothetical protein [uncultured Faecalibaculum sp.]